MSASLITKAQLLADTHNTHDVDPFPYTNTGMGMAHNARCTYITGTPYRITPGNFKMYKLIDDGDPDVDANRVYVAAMIPWYELSSEDRIPRNAKVAFTRAFVWTMSTSGVWTQRSSWGGSDLTGHGFVWNGAEDGTPSYEPGGTFTYGTTTVDGISCRTYGWGSIGGTGVAFGDHSEDTGAPFNDGFVRVHGWPLSWTEVDSDSTPNDIWWPAQDPTDDTSDANRTLGNSIAAIAWGMEVVVVGPEASSAKYVLQTGIDHQYEGAPTVDLPAGSREGTGGRQQRLGTTRKWVTGHTLSDEQLDSNPPPFMTEDSGPAPTGPHCTVTPASISFGSVEVGNTSPTRYITITNSGDVEANLTARALPDNGFWLGTDGTNGDALVVPSVLVTDVTIPVTFKPTSSGTRTSSTSFTFDDGLGIKTVLFSGTGYVAPPPPDPPPDPPDPRPYDPGTTPDDPEDTEVFSPGAQRTAWRFRDYVADINLFLPVNPKADDGGNGIQKNIAFSSEASTYNVAGAERINDVVALDTGTSQQRFAYSGTIYTKEQYDGLRYFFNLDYPWKMRDDLGREWIVYVDNFSIDRMRSAHYKWKSSYKVTGLILQELS